MKLLKTLIALTIIPASYAASAALTDSMLTESTASTTTAVSTSAITERPTGSVLFFFKTLMGKTLAVDVDPDAPLSDFKEILFKQAQANGVPNVQLGIDCMKVIVRGKKALDHQSFNDVAGGRAIKLGSINLVFSK